MSNTYAPLILQDRPIGYWRMNEAGGSVAHDISGHGYSAGLANFGSGSVTLGHSGLVADSDSGSVLFTPTDDGGHGRIFFPVLPPPSTFIGWQNALTVEFMMKATNPFSIAAFDSAPIQIYGVRIWNGSADWSSTTALGKVSTGIAQHWVVVFHGANVIDIYVDGKSYSSSSSSGNGQISWGNSDSPDYYDGLGFLVPQFDPLIGVIYDQYNVNTSGERPIALSYMDGYLSEFALYNYALSADRIMAHANAVKGGGPLKPTSLAEQVVDKVLSDGGFTVGAAVRAMMIADVTTLITQTSTTPC